MKAAIISSALVSIFIVAPVFYLLADNEPPYVYDLEHSYIIPTQVHSTHQAVAHWSVSRVNRVCRGITVSTVVDDVTKIKTFYDAQPAIIVDPADSDKFGKVLERPFWLAPGILPGPKIYKGESYYACNILQNLWPLHVSTPPLPFEVIE